MILMSTLTDIGNTLMTPFYWMISSVMIFFHWVFGAVFGDASGISWVLAILFMTVVIRGIMLPLYARQLNSQRSMTALQPKLKALQEKYKGDRQRLGTETMKLYQDNGVSPYASCLPMIAQMPVFLSVFWVISPVARAFWAGGPLGGWVSQDQANWGVPPGSSDGTAPIIPHGMFFHRPDLVESFQHAKIFGSSLSQTFLGADSSIATKVLVIVVVLLLMATLFYQQWYMMKRNMPPTMMQGPMGQQQKVMLYVFPFMYLFSGMAVPLGVMFYWLVSNVWTMMQQYFMVRVYPTPDTPAYAEWEDRMIAQGKDPVAIERARVEAAKSKRKGGGLTAKMAAAAQQQSGGAGGAKPASGGQDVRPAKTSGGNKASSGTGVSDGASESAETAVAEVQSASGKKVVVRQQPHKKSRAKRKH